MQNLTQSADYLEKVNEDNFFTYALELYNAQYQGLEVYRRFVDAFFGKNYKPERLESLPFLPISFFKSHDVYCSSRVEEAVFLSSGSTTAERSKHRIADLSLYERSFFHTYKRFLGEPKEQCLMALLPSYQQQGDSSLVYMVQRLIESSDHKWSQFYLNQTELLTECLGRIVGTDKKVVLFGVTYALLELAESRTFSNCSNLSIIETGGMKGRRQEITREELHAKLSSSFSGARIGSEYGMTELLSQAYAIDSNKFICPPWMKVMVRDASDPKQVGLIRKRGGINIIDLANKYSCSFIQTDDLGIQHEDSCFEVLGRMDNSDIRGCSQLS